MIMFFPFLLMWEVDWFVTQWFLPLAESRGSAPAPCADFLLQFCRCLPQVCLLIFWMNSQMFSVFKQHEDDKIIGHLGLTLMSLLRGTSIKQNGSSQAGRAGAHRTLYPGSSDSCKHPGLCGPRAPCYTRALGCDTAMQAASPRVAVPRAGLRGHRNVHFIDSPRAVIKDSFKCFHHLKR